MIINSTHLKKTLEDENRWDILLSNSLNANYMANLHYSNSWEFDGRVSKSFIFSKDNLDIAGALYSQKKSILNLINVSDLKSGILFRKEPDTDAFRFILNHYLDWAVHNKVSFARLNTKLPKIIDGNNITYSKSITEIILSSGFSEITKPKHTYWIDLTLSEEELLKNMKSQTRYRINQGLRSEIKTIIYDKPDEEIINKFWNQYKLIGEKKKFYMYSEQKFKHEVTFLLEAGIANLFVANYQGTIINFSLASNFGIASYLHGAINPEFKKLQGCPSPGQLAQWEMIRKVKALGARIYDMGFCPGPLPIPEHPKFPIWSFKYGFGGKAVEFLPVYGKVIQPFRGRLFYFLNK